MKKKNRLNDHDEVSLQIKTEVIRQRKKWGYQEHHPGDWMLIFAEEYGEVARHRLEGDNDQYIAELIQCGAVLASWIEAEANRLDIDLDRFAGSEIVARK